MEPAAIEVSSPSTNCPDLRRACVWQATCEELRALAAIQKLYRLNSEKDREIRELQLKNAQMSRQLGELGTIKARLDSLEHQSGLIRTRAE